MSHLNRWFQSIYGINNLKKEMGEELFKKTIVIIANTSWYIFNFRANLIRASINQGFRVVALSPSDDYSTELVRLGCEYYDLKIDSKSKNPLKDLLLMFKLIHKFKIVKPDLILSFTAKPNIYATIIGRMKGIPAINNIAGLGYGFVKDSLITRVLKVLYRISQKTAQHVFFQNEDDLKFFLKNRIVSTHNSSLLPGSGINLDRFKQTSLPNIRGNKFIFLLMSRALYSKGIEILFESASFLYDKGLTNFKIQFLGDINVINSDAIPISKISKWTKMPYFEYLGMKSDVVPYIENSHCVVLPSYYREGTPKSILEGLGVGRPIITTDMPGCKNTVIDGFNGFIVPPKNIQALAQKMKDMMELDFDELQLMGNRSRKLAEEKYDETIVINEYLKEIENVLKKR